MKKRSKNAEASSAYIYTEQNQGLEGIVMRSDNVKKFEPFIKKVWLSSPTMHGEELKYVTELMKPTGCRR